MKKKLEAELISIAHRILKLKNKSELIQLHQEAQKLYEKLSVLRFVEENFADVKPTIGRTQIEEKLEAAFDTVAETEEFKTEVAPSEAEPIAEAEEIKAEEPTVEPAAEEEIAAKEFAPEAEAPQPEAIEEVEQIPAEENVELPTAEIEETETEETVEEDEDEETLETAESLFKPAFELSFENKSEEVKEDAKDEFKNPNAQITFEDILGSSYVDPVFVKPEDLQKEHEAVKTDNVIPIGRSFSDNSNVISINKTDNESKAFSLNDRLSKGITIGLNDRVAFMKHLFANSSEDYNRVLSQLMTFDTFEDAKDFIDNMVKPDYNNWDGKDEYAERFMEIVEKKFS
jgi:chemotaxis protein histidine kinase CheA